MAVRAHRRTDRPRRVADGLSNVREQGGAYFGAGPQNGNYAEMDRTVAYRLLQKGGLEHVATWAPREPLGVDTPISEGAGQYRAIGRMITLSTSRRSTACSPPHWTGSTRSRPSPR